MRGKYLLLALVVAAPGAARADDATETQLRAALQQATSQIADLQNQVANLQAAEAPDAAMIEALKAQLQTLQKNGPAPAAGGATAAQSGADDKELASLRRQVAAQAAELAKTKGAYQSASAAADAKAAANTRLTAQLAARDAAINACDAKNAVLFKLGNQILDAYGHKDNVFNVIANHEPFIGFKRVQLENAVQNDQQTMLDNQIAPAPAGQ
jgi:DNA repair exonuclease SbcCD ATPase subunit